MVKKALFISETILEIKYFVMELKVHFTKIKGGFTCIIPKIILCITQVCRAILHNQVYGDKKHVIFRTKSSISLLDLLLV